MFVYHPAGAESSTLVEEGKAMGFVGSELLGYVSDRRKDTERDGTRQQSGEYRSESDEAGGQLRNLRLQDETIPEERSLKMEAGVQSELSAIRTENCSRFLQAS